VGTCYCLLDNSQFLEIFKLGLERVLGEDKETSPCQGTHQLPFSCLSNIAVYLQFIYSLFIAVITNYNIQLTLPAYSIG